MKLNVNIPSHLSVVCNLKLQHPIGWNKVDYIFFAVSVSCRLVLEL